MARIVCQVLHRANRVTFLWSEGSASFEPYHLEGAEQAKLLDLAGQIHAKLPTGSPAELASLGHALWRTMLRLDVPDAGAATAVFGWLTNLLRNNAIERIQFLSDRPGLVPWNLLCDTTASGWEQFWGARLNLGTGRRVNALWMNPTLVLPTQLGAAGIDLVELLSPGDQQLLGPLRDANRLVHTFASLEDDLRKRGPDILLLLVRWAKGRPWLGGDAVDLASLRAAVDETVEGNPEPVVILMGTGATQEQATWPAFVEAASMHFGGLIANETLLSPAQALTIGAAIANRLSNGKSNVGAILHTLRQEHGAAALAFSAFCPLEVHVSTDPAVDAAPSDFVSDTSALPEAPYRPFAAYDAAERALFFGRDIEMARAAAQLDDGRTAGVLLHGNPAVGKTSFLQAALIPHLEQENHGYLLLRDRSLQEAAAAEKDYPRLILRATDDLAGQFADALSVFCARPLTYSTPTGAKVMVDLPDLLQRAVTGAGRASTAIMDAAAASAIAVEAPPPSQNNAAEPLTSRDVWIALRDDKDALGRVLDAITRPLPFELVIAIDQGEELITLARTTQQRERRQKALAMLEQLAEVAPRCKIVVALRSQAFGQLIGLVRGNHKPASWRSFCLNPLREDDMVGALLWPTNRAAIPFTDEVPFSKYGFAYEEGLAQRIVSETIDAAKTARISPLPILQAVGALLYENQVIGKKQNVLRLADLNAFGGVKEALGKCLEQKIKRLNLAGATADALRGLLGKLTISSPDGSVSRALVPASDLKSQWKTAGESFEQVVNRAADREGLFEIQQLFIGGQEDLFVSLPQDSLAQLGTRVEVEREAQKAARTKVIDMLWVMIPLTFLACAVTFWGTKNFASSVSALDDEMKKKIQTFVEEESTARAARSMRGVRQPLYYGQLARIQQALHAENAQVAQQVLMEFPAMRSRNDALKSNFPELRGFEWYYLKKALNAERYPLFGHSSVVTSVAVTRDSERAATGSIDGTVRIWNLKNGELLALLTGPKTPVHAIAFAPDGKTLASGGVDKIVRLWDLSNLKTDYVEIKKESKSLKGHTADIHALAFGKDANTLASAGADKSVIIWDVAKDKEGHTLKEHGAAVHALAFDKDGKTLLSAGAEASVIVWDPTGGKKVSAIKTGYQTIHALSLSADGKTVSTGGVESKLGVDTGAVRFWQVDGGKESGTAITQGPAVLAVAFAPDGKAIAAAGRDHVVRLFDIATGKQMRRWLGHLGQVNALAFAPDDSVLISGSHDQMAKAWNPAQSSGADVITGAHTDHVQCLALNAKGDVLASGGRDGAVKLWNPTTGKLLKETSVGAPVVALALSSHKDKPYLAVATRGDAAIKLFQIEQDKGDYSVKSLSSLTGHAKAVNCLAFGPLADKADILISGGADDTVKLWDIGKAKEMASYKEHKSEVRSLAFNTEGTSFASGAKDGSVCLYEVARPTGVWLATGLHTNSIDALAFMPAAPSERGEILRVITGSADQSMGIFDLYRGEPGPVSKKEKQRHFRGHVQPITALVFNDKFEGMFGSAGADGVIKLYDTLNETLTLTGHIGPVRALVAAPDQSFLASAGDDGTIRFWRAAERSEKEKLR